MVIEYTSYQLRQLCQRSTKSLMRVSREVYYNLKQLDICYATPTHRGTTGETTLNVNTVVGLYEHAVLSTIDLHAPLTLRMKACRRKEPWYNDNIRKARALRRANEKRWRTTKLEVHRQIFVEHRTAANNKIKRAKRAHYESVLSSLDQPTCFRVVTTLPIVAELFPVAHRE
ncbi:hypothetical protein NP493_781g00012 [Ridgeia piscesae]|uniref:Uncharacterized protein n=1 Tax=Ridgeia piscesae TaxID=27915 RepID=A0AAD9NLR3_RIDPI|nr:hypothetical protein NP493_781g00012 [Ridgeia piscesae]